MKANTATAKAIGLMMIVVFLLSSAEFLSAKEREMYKTGLPELTEEELQWQNKHMLKVKKIKLNKIGLERVNQWRAKKGKGKIDKDEMDVAAVPNGPIIWLTAAETTEPGITGPTKSDRNTARPPGRNSPMIPITGPGA